MTIDDYRLQFEATLKLWDIAKAEQRPTFVARTAESERAANTLDETIKALEKEMDRICKAAYG